MVNDDHARPLFLRPPHVADPLIVEFDVPLFIALGKVSGTNRGDKICDAVSLFNRANTDASEVSDSVELVMLRAAYETLLESGFQTTHLKQKFVAHFSEELVEPTWESGNFTKSEWEKRWPGKNVAQRPLEMWVDDFCHARNASAHGTSSTSNHQPPMWSMHNHLLFASWLFPLIVKKILETAGFYSLSDNERDCRAHVENFFAYDVFERDDNRRLLWGLPLEKISDASLNRTIQKSYSQSQSS